MTTTITRQRKPTPAPSGVILSYHSVGKMEAEILSAFIPNHPRAFWQHSKYNFKNPTDCTPTLIRSAGADERLLRLMCLALHKKDGFSHRDRIEMRVREAQGALISKILSFPNKSPAWRLARLKVFKPSLDLASAGDIFQHLGHAAMQGQLECAEFFLERFPDKKLGKEQADRQRFGVCGYQSHGWGSPEAQLHAQASIVAELSGVKKSIPAKFDREYPSNAWFYIAARHGALAQSNPAEAARWANMGIALIDRGLEPTEKAETLAHIMPCRPLFDAIRQSRPALGSPSFYCFERTGILFEALSKVQDAASVAAICSYDETGSDCRGTVEVTVGKRKPQLVSAIPSSAIALLAGHQPDDSWIELGADRQFKIPSAIIEKAKAGTLSREHLARFDETRGCSMTLATLCAELSKAAAKLPQAQPVKKIKTSP